MNFHVLTLFPEMIMQGMEHSITGRAMKDNLISVEAVNIRDYTKDKHRKVDDYPYGGGAGMLMQAQPVYDAYQSVADRIDKKARKRVIYVTPQGTPFRQKLAEELAENDDLIFLCGHYEGIDERVLEEIVTDYISIGDYVLTGGELPSLVMMDAISRLVPGVLNNEESSETESFHGDLLEHPQYSRPAVWHDKKVPEVLLSGNQRDIRQWRLEQSIRRTRIRRPDLYEKYMELDAWRQRMLRDKLHHIDMIETINRGDGILVAQTESELLLQERCTGVFLHTCLGDSITIETLHKASEEVVLHQEEARDLLLATGEWSPELSCRQVAYTNREKLPITGLYRNDVLPREDGFVIRPLTMEHYEYVAKNYHCMGDESEYVQYLIEKGGHMWGAFFGEQIVGFMGKHGKGEMGLLFVDPSFRGKKIAMALETYVINHELELGNLPYGAVVEGNEASFRLQEKLGLHASKGMIYWMCRNM